MVVNFVVVAAYIALQGTTKFVGGGSVFGDCGAVSTDGGFQKSFHLLIILEVFMAHLSRKDHRKNAIVIGMHF